LGIIPAFDPF